MNKTVETYINRIAERIRELEAQNLSELDYRLDMYKAMLKEYGFEMVDGELYRIEGYKPAPEFDEVIDDRLMGEIRQAYRCGDIRPMKSGCFLLEDEEYLDVLLDIAWRRHSWMDYHEMIWSATQG